MRVTDLDLDLDLDLEITDIPEDEETHGPQPADGQAPGVAWG
jgi:lantipeptide (TIGR04451 family)